MKLNSNENVFTIFEDKIIQVTNEQLNKINTIICKLEENEEYKFLFRGDKLHRLKRKLHNENSFNCFSLVFEIGEKARNFVPTNDNRDNTESDYSEEFILDNYTEEAFEVLFNKIKLVLDNEENDEIIMNFKSEKENEEFINYFTNNKNKELFIELVKNESKKTKRDVKDYFSTFLHTEGKSIVNYSYFVSTSEIYKVANDFASKNIKSDDEKIIFLYYINKPFINHGILCNYKQNIKKTIKILGLPFYKALYKNEKEFSIRGGLYPHNIVYIKFYENNIEKFFINPAILTNDEVNLKFGFPVDQKNFSSTIQNTDYTRYVVYNGEQEITYQV